MRALVVDPGFSRGALAATRALHTAGWDVGVGSPAGSAAAWSRSCSSRHRIPRAEASAEEFTAAVRHVVEEGGYDVVFSCGDAEARVLSSERDRIPAAVGYGPHSAMEQVLDKKRLESAARAAGIATPPSYPTFDEARAAGAERVIVKARTHWISQASNAPVRYEARVVDDEAAARDWVGELKSAGLEPLLQRHVSGTLIGMPILVGANGEVIAKLQQLTETTFPPAAGEVTRVVTVDVDHELCERLSTLLRSLGWEGLIQAQLIAGPEGTFLIDLNPRFYASLGLALRAGVNLPDLWGRVATDRPTGCAEAEVGVRYQWLEGDIRRAIRETATPREVIGSVRWSRGALHATWSPADPLPALRNGIELARLGARKLARSLR